jgi:hypothetical protein
VKNSLNHLAEQITVQAQHGHTNQSSLGGVMKLMSQLQTRKPLAFCIHEKLRSECQGPECVYAEVLEEPAPYNEQDMAERDLHRMIIMSGKYNVSM